MYCLGFNMQKIENIVSMITYLKVNKWIYVFRTFQQNAYRTKLWFLLAYQTFELLFFLFFLYNVTLLLASVYNAFSRFIKSFPADGVDVAMPNVMFRALIWRLYSRRFPVLNSYFTP